MGSLCSLEAAGKTALGKRQVFFKGSTFCEKVEDIKEFIIGGNI